MGSHPPSKKVQVILQEECELLADHGAACGRGGGGGGGVKMESPPSFCNVLGTIYLTSF